MKFSITIIASQWVLQKFRVIAFTPYQTSAIQSPRKFFLQSHSTLEQSKIDLSCNGRGNLSCSDILFFERYGHFLSRSLFSNEEMNVLKFNIMGAYKQFERSSLEQKVSVLLGEEKLTPNASMEDLYNMLKQLPSEDIPFLQVFNMWRKLSPFRETIQELVYSERLAKTAASLLGCNSVRLYQDSIFVKRTGDGPTNWHSDLNMAPFDTNDMITAWIPLNDVPSYEDNGTGLIFASKSHKDFALNYWQNPHGNEDLSERYTETPQHAMNVGDVSWHHGWLLHSANGNEMPETRIAFTVSYIADGAIILSEEALHHCETEDSWSYNDWIQDVFPGEPVDHPFVPLVYENLTAI